MYIDMHLVLIIFIITYCVALQLINYANALLENVGHNLNST